VTRIPVRKSKTTAGWSAMVKRVVDNRWLLLMILPAVIIQLAFAYVPMAGMSLAFRNISELTLPFGTKWIGFDNFYFVTDPYFWETVRNTIVIAGVKLIFIFPAPIVLALLLNEIKNQKFKRFVQ